MGKDIFETEEKVEIKTIEKVTKSSIFTKNLIEARKNMNLTSTEVGKHFNSGHTRITNWETGISVPRLPELVKLCELYKITPNKLLGFE